MMGGNAALGAGEDAVPGEGGLGVGAGELAGGDEEAGGVPEPEAGLVEGLLGEVDPGALADVPGDGPGGDPGDGPADVSGDDAWPP